MVSCSVNLRASEKDDSLKEEGGELGLKQIAFLFVCFFSFVLFSFCSLFPQEHARTQKGEKVVNAYQEELIPVNTGSHT